MATPPSDDTRMLFKLLADRGLDKWHPYQQIRDALALTVPPGRALRKYDERLEASRRSRNVAVNTPPLSESERIELGARACAQVVITSWKGRGLMYRTENGVKEIRVKPGFKSWGLETAVGEDDSAAVPQGSTDPPPTVSGPSTPGPVGQDPPPPQASPVAQDRPEPVTAKPEQVEPESQWKSAEELTVEPNLPHTIGREQPSQSVTAGEFFECSECGLGVINPVQHDAWHDGQKAALEPSDVALLDEKAMVTLLGDVMGQALDKFQAGMQAWMEEQFMQVGDQITALKPTVARWAQGRQ